MVKASVSWLGWLAVAGNAVFIAWVLYNGVNEGFRATLPEMVSLIGLIGLLILNTFLIVTRRNI